MPKLCPFRSTPETEVACGSWCMLSIELSGRGVFCSIPQIAPKIEMFEDEVKRWAESLGRQLIEIKTILAPKAGRSGI